MCAVFYREEKDSKHSSGTKEFHKDASEENPEAGSVVFSNNCHIFKMIVVGNFKICNNKLYSLTKYFKTGKKL